MTENQFDELTNLYLDNEIGRRELEQLKDAIRQNVLRRRKFEHACEIHQAARKALAARADAGAPARNPGDERGAGASFMAVANPAPVAARAPERPRGRSSTADGPNSLKQKQVQAHRNASVATLAERQLNKGAASEMDLAEINLESRRLPKSSGSGKSDFSFFDSPTGLITGMILLGLGAGAMYYILKFNAPIENADGTVNANVPIIRQSDVAVDPQVLKELSADQKNHPAADVARARIYQAALTGQPAANTLPENYYASPADTAPASLTPAVQASLNLVMSSSADTGTGNLAPPTNIGAPGASVLAPGQDLGIKLPLPALPPPTPAVDDNPPPSNQTTLPVMLP